MTAGRDGAVKFWNGEDLLFWRVLHNGPSWITGMTYLPQHSMLCTCTVDRCLSYFNVGRSTVELSGRLYIPGMVQDS